MCDPVRYIESLPREKRRAAWLILGAVVAAMWIAITIGIVASI